MQNEIYWRLCFFLGVLFLIGALESLVPYRRQVGLRRHRIGCNLALGLLGTLVVRFIPVLSAVKAAEWAQNSQWGLLNFLPWPNWLEILLAVSALDCLIYWQHVIFHRVPWLWQVHRVHHADVDLDSTSGIRFHTVEYALSMGIKVIAIWILGASPFAVVVFEIILNALAIVTHGNFALPVCIEPWIRWMFVTPSMHRIHHSIDEKEMNSNFGFNMSVWDRLFRTYVSESKQPQQIMRMGIPELQDSKAASSLWVMLWLPFRKSENNVGDKQASSSVSG